MPIIESVMGIQVIGNNGENIIKSPIVEAYIGSSLLDSTEVASDTPTDISTKVEQLMAAKHTHANKAVLDKFAEIEGKPTYNGTAIGGSGASSAENVSYTNENLEDITTVKEALDSTVDVFLEYNNMFEYMGNELNQKVSLSDITPEAIGAKAVTTKVSTGDSFSMNDNTEYRLTNVTTLTLYAPHNRPHYECWFSLTFANSGTITVTLPTDMKYIGSAPDFNNGESWEMSIKDGVVIAQKIGDGT